MKTKKIAVLLGGPSTEREVSLKTGGNIAQALRKQGYHVDEIDFDPRHFIDQLSQSQPDVVFIALHGRFGEDGSVQGFLDICGIPYTGSGLRASSVAMDKYLAKELFEAFHIPTPLGVLCSPDEALEVSKAKISKLGYPVVMKPTTQGSSIGIYKAKNEEELLRNLQLAFQYGEVLVEKFVKGKELTVPVLEGKGPLPIIEIRPYSGEYDYESKYTEGKTEYLVPAPISEELTQKIQDIAVQVSSVLKCRGVSRVDIMLDEKTEIPYVLEINTIPGMTQTSLVPKSAAAAGIEYDELCELILAKAQHDG